MLNLNLKSRNTSCSARIKLRAPSEAFSVRKSMVEKNIHRNIESTCACAHQCYGPAASSSTVGKGTATVMTTIVLAFREDHCFQPWYLLVVIPDHGPAARKLASRSGCRRSPVVRSSGSKLRDCNIVFGIRSFAATSQDCPKLRSPLDSGSFHTPV